MRRIRTLTATLAIALWAIATASGQSPIGNGQDLTPPPADLVVEVYYYPKEPPAYLTVSPSQLRSLGSGFQRFGRVPGWRASVEFPKVNAVDIRPAFSGDVVQITISVLSGKMNEHRLPVAVYSVREGEKVRVQELIKFGVEPFELALVRIAPANADLPQFVSKAPSIELVTIQANLSTLPSHRLLLRNVSGKNVSALMVRTFQNRIVKLSGFRQGKEDNPLIPAGSAAEITQRAITRATATPGGYKPVSPKNQTIEISTAIFSDGSYEGEVETAVQYLALLKGRKTQLLRVVALFQEAAENGQPDLANLFDTLRNGVAQLKTEADPALLQELLNDFPAFTGKTIVKGSIEGGMFYFRKDVLDDIRRFQVEHPTLDSNSLRGWLAASKQKYEARLSRL